MRPTRRTPAQRRSDAAPLALVLACWALAVGPVAHPLLVHGVPFLRGSADERWVRHHDGRHDQSRPRDTGAHRHAPGAPEHLQVPLLAAAAPAAFQTVLIALPAPPHAETLVLSLPRRWSQEQPQAP